MRVIIVGGGRLGSSLTAKLFNEGHQVRLVGRAEDLSRTKPKVPEEVLVPARLSDPVLLESIGIRQTEVVAAVTNSDETNLVVASLARFEFSVPRVIARVNNPKNAWMFTDQMGVDVALNQAEIMSHMIAEEMSLGDMMTLLKLQKGKYSIVEEKIDHGAVAVGKAIKDLNLPEECVLVAIIRAGNLMIPRGNTLLEAKDEVISVVSKENLKALAKIFGVV